jgi:hypothetical protein
MRDRGVVLEGRHHPPGEVGADEPHLREVPRRGAVRAVGELPDGAVRPLDVDEVVAVPDLALIEQKSVLCGHDVMAGVETDESQKEALRPGVRVGSSTSR